MADAPIRYKLLPRGAFGTPPWAVPTEAHRQAEHAVRWLQTEMDWCHGVEVRWFDLAGPHDWDGDPGVFTSRHPLWGCVDPKAPTEARLNVALARQPVRKLIEIAVHEAVHAEELDRGLHRRLDHAGLEALTQDITALLCAGVA